jgi:ATP-binding cassette subfamily B protein
MPAYSWIWQYIRKYLPLMIAGLVLTLLAAALGLVNPYISGRVIDEVFEQGLAYRLRPLLTIMICVTFTKTVVHYVFRRLFEAASQGALVDMRRDIYKQVQIQTHTFFDNNRVGDIMSRLTGDLDAIRHFLAYVVYSLFENVVMLIAALILLFAISWELALLILLITPVIAVTAYRQSREIKPAFTRIREQFSRLNTVCQENISGNRVVKAFSKEDYEIEKFTTDNQEFWNANVDSSKIWVKYLPILDFCAGAMFFVLLLAGGILVITDHLELWKLVTVNGYLWAVSNPLRMFGWLLNDTQRFNASLDKIFAMMCERVDIYSPDPAVKTERIKGKVEFDSVYFGYDVADKSDKTRVFPGIRKKMILKDISFTVLPGQTVGIVGATGSGKTSLINLIGRFYDVTRCRVLVDDVDVRQYDLQNLRQGIAAATQDVFLFSDTVEGNVAYGVPDVPMEGVEEAAKTACAHDFIVNLESGYDTIVGERGVGLSGGQKQRLALARALATDPAILILDDTTSAVDMETEHEIQNALREKHSAGTKFIIAHRLSSVMHADLILVMEGGRIAERGSHAELLEQKGMYYQLFLNQYGDYATETGKNWSGKEGEVCGA